MANSSRSKRGAAPEIQPGRDNMLTAVVVLLFTAVICFGIGILVGRYQPAAKQEAPTEGAQVERVPGSGAVAKNETPAKDRARTSSVEGAQISPSPVIIPSDKKAGSAPPSRQLNQREPNTQIVAPPPPRRKDEKEADMASAATATVEPPAAPTPAQEEPKPEPATETVAPVAEPATTPVEPTPASEIEPTPATETATAAASSTGFTIQVGSFDTQANANRFRRTIESKSDYQVKLYPAKDGSVVKACIGEYADKDAAMKAREELSRINDFKGCFVKAINEL